MMAMLRILFNANAEDDMTGDYRQSFPAWQAEMYNYFKNLEVPDLFVAFVFTGVLGILFHELNKAHQCWVRGEGGIEFTTILVIGKPILNNVRYATYGQICGQVGFV